MLRLREPILERCFQRYDGPPFASGETANNKINIEKIQDDLLLRGRIIRTLGKKVMAHNPTFVSAVPNGANWIAEDITEYYNIPFVRLKRNIEDPTKFEFNSREDRELCQSLDDGVLIEDVINKFTNTRRALAIPSIGKRIVAVEAILDRGLPSERTEPGIPYNALITNPIPAILPPDSPLWVYAR